MKNYLYQRWAESTLFMALALVVVLFSFLPQTSWPLFLIWLQFPVYLIHEFEEHVYPGKFRQFMNREVFHSSSDEFPLSPASVFWINISAIWILFPLAATLAQRVSLEYGVLLPVFGLFNATLHILFFIIKRKYNPGLLVSLFLNYPTGLYTLWILKQYGWLTMQSFTIAFLVTFLGHAAIIFVILNRKKLKSTQL